MAKRETLFSMLLRSSWWVSIAIGAGVFALSSMLVPLIFGLLGGRPNSSQVVFLATFAALPFIGIACYTGWKALRAPSVRSVGDVLGRLRGMPTENFAAIIEEAYRRAGYSVSTVADGAADLELRKNGRATVVSWKRWKVAQTGMGPLRDLYEAKRRRDAHEAFYIAAGEFSSKARQFAGEKNIHLVNDAELAQLVGKVERGKRKWLLFS